MDDVDLLHDAEDRIGALETALADFINLEDAADFTDLVFEHRHLLATLYCRAECLDEDGERCCSDYCGCPCHDREESLEGE